MKLKAPTLLLTLFALLALPSALMAQPKRTIKNTMAFRFPLEVQVDVRSEFVAQHAAAVEMRALRVDVVELRRLAVLLVASRLASH